MADRLSNIGDQVRALPPARRWALAASAAGSLAFFTWIAFGMNEQDYRLLYRGFAADETAKVVEVLRAEKIPYRLEEGGGSISVPASMVYEARIRVAGKGLPSGSSPGLEIFDTPRFGVSDFVNRVNFQRALQGELARSIEQLASIDRARVQVAVPKRRRFVSGRSEKSSASVVVRLHPGAELDPQQVRGIVHLVASSVQGLSAEDVTLVDQRGRMLAPDVAGTAGASAPAGSLAHQERLERELADRIESILERTVGQGGVVARVRAELDWTQTESTHERYDPDSQVARSEQRSTERSSEGSTGAAGIPGIASNAPAGIGGAGSGGDSRSSRSSTTETINYEIDKVVSRTVQPLGTIERLDVAVLIDSSSAPSADAGWDAATLLEFEELAKRAIGFSSERGDQIAVRSAPFRAAPIEVLEGGWLDPEMILLATSVLRFAGILLALVLFARLVVRPVVNRLATAPVANLPARAGDLELQLAGVGSDLSLGEGASAQGASIRGQVASEENMRALRTWLRE
ncbi:MAG: flagellar basal-body MS-ring/collar protein FliF [Myxococcota bacterium]